MEIGSKIANRESWNGLKPLSKMRIKLKLERSFTEEEFQKISFGLIPTCMEDKWLIFLEGNNLYFHRSWTGECIYQVIFSKERNFHIPTEVYVCRNPIKYKFFSKKYDERLISFLIENLLLGNNMPFPLPKLLEKIVPKAAFQHSIAGTSYLETEIEED